MNPSDPTAHLPWSQKLRLARRNWEHSGRDLLLRGLKFLRAGGGQTDLAELPKSCDSIRRILILRTGKAIGDAVMSLVLIPECRRLFEAAQVDLLLRDNVSPLFLEGTGAHRVLELHPKFLKWPEATLSLLLALRRRKYDLVICCDTPTKSSFTTLCLCLWTGAKLRLGFDNQESRDFLNVRVSATSGEPMITSLLKLPSPFGKMPARALPVLHVPEIESDRSSVLFKSGAKPVLIFAANHWRKSWTLETFLFAASEITSRDQPVLLAFGPGDTRVDSDEVKAWIKTSRGLGSVLPPLKLPAFAPLLAQCSLFLSNDCGPYHIAVAVGIPAVAVFLSEEGRRDFGYHEPPRLVAIHQPTMEGGRREALEAAWKILGEKPHAPRLT